MISMDMTQKLLLKVVSSNMKLVGSLIKIGLLLVQTIKENNIGICMGLRLPIDTVLIS